MTTPQHCPGFEAFKDMAVFTCTCPQCGTEKEIFSDEFQYEHKCSKCQQPIDFKKCVWSGGAKQPPQSTNRERA